MGLGEFVAICKPARALASRKQFNIGTIIERLDDSIELIGLGAVAPDGGIEDGADRLRLRLNAAAARRHYARLMGTAEDAAHPKVGFP